MARMPDDADRIREVTQLEEERCRAISEQDWSTLEALLADDLTHTHVTGLRQDKQTYLSHVKHSPRETHRGDLTVRFYSDVAVVTGPQINIRRGGSDVSENSIETIQVWAKTGSSWQLVAFAASGSSG